VGLRRDEPSTLEALVRGLGVCTVDGCDVLVVRHIRSLAPAVNNINPDRYIRTKEVV